VVVVKLHDGGLDMKRKSKKSGIVERSGVVKRSNGGVGKRGGAVRRGEWVDTDNDSNLYLDAAMSCTQALILHLDELLEKFDKIDNLYDFLEKNEQEN
jgi:hypothetical protein